MVQYKRDKNNFYLSPHLEIWNLKIFICTRSILFQKSQAHIIPFAYSLSPANETKQPLSLSPHFQFHKTKNLSLIFKTDYAPNVAHNYNS